MLLPVGAVAQGPQTLPEIQVISTSPLGGIGIDRDKVPALVQTVTADDFARTYSSNVTDTLFQRIPGVSTSDQQGNNFQTDIRYRGFVASPVPGQPQGLAVYMNGMRVNEAFGDTVNFDFVPTNAIARADIQSNNPVFGLNALGGAVTILMRDGFSFQGTEIDIRGGSFGRYQGELATGQHSGNWAAFLSLEGIHDDGWRQFSPTNVRRGYADVGAKDDKTEVHLNFTAADIDFGATTAAPVQLLDLNWSNSFTSPQVTTNRMTMVSLNGQVKATPSLTLSGVTYYRWFQQVHADANLAEALE